TKQLPRANKDEFLVRPPYVFSGKNVRIAYPGFLTWLKFVDPDRQGIDLNKKVTEYGLAKAKYELAIADLLKQLREGNNGKVFESSKIIMDQIDGPDGRLVTIRPLPWDKSTEPDTPPDDENAAMGDIHTGFVRAGSGSTIRISPEALSNNPEDVLVPD